MLKADANTRVASAVAWMALAIAASILLVGRSHPYGVVFAGAALALITPERDDPGWSGFIPSSLTRVSDTLLFAALAWSLGRHDAEIAGSAAALALLSLALISAYVRLRAASLAIDGGGLGRAWTGVERSVRLILVGIGLAGPLVEMVWAATAFTATIAIVRSAGVWRNAAHG